MNLEEVVTVVDGSILENYCVLLCSRPVPSLRVISTQTPMPGASGSNRFSFAGRRGSKPCMGIDSGDGYRAAVTKIG